MIAVSVRLKSVGFIMLAILAAAALAAVIIACKKGESVLSEADARRYLAGRGVAAESCTVREITVPAEWSAVYSDYAELQRSGGFNLRRYRGRAALLYSFPLDGGEYSANLLVCGGRVIAADLSHNIPGGEVAVLVG